MVNKAILPDNFVRHGQVALGSLGVFNLYPANSLQPKLTSQTLTSLDLDNRMTLRALKRRAWARCTNAGLFWDVKTSQALHFRDQVAGTCRNYRGYGFSLSGCTKWECLERLSSEMVCSKWHLPILLVVVPHAQMHFGPPPACTHDFTPHSVHGVTEAGSISGIGWCVWCTRW